MRSGALRITVLGSLLDYRNRSSGALRDDLLVNLLGIFFWFLPKLSFQQSLYLRPLCFDDAKAD